VKCAVEPSTKPTGMAKDASKENGVHFSVMLFAHLD